jgi:hypothetical protein
MKTNRNKVIFFFLYNIYMNNKYMNNKYEKTLDNIKTQYFELLYGGSSTRDDIMKINIMEKYIHNILNEFKFNFEQLSNINGLKSKLVNKTNNCLVLGMEHYHQHGEINKINELNYLNINVKGNLRMYKVDKIENNVSDDIYSDSVMTVCLFIPNPKESIEEKSNTIISYGIGVKILKLKDITIEDVYNIDRKFLTDDYVLSKKYKSDFPNITIVFVQKKN